MALRPDVLEFARTAEIDPLQDVEIAARIDTKRMRSGEQGRVALIVRFVRFAIRFPAIAEVGHEFALGIKDRDARSEIRNEQLLFKLVETARIANIARQRALVIQFHRIDLEAIVMTISDKDFRIAF
jgi:hypothetical protein